VNGQVAGVISVSVLFKFLVLGSVLMRIMTIRQSSLLAMRSPPGSADAGCSCRRREGAAPNSLAKAASLGAGRACGRFPEGFNNPDARLKQQFLN
jgi:hypothetical protein